MHIHTSEWRQHLLSWGLFWCAAFVLALCISVFTSIPTHAANANFSNDAFNLNGSSFTETDIPCGSNKNADAETDIRNFAGDPDCSGDVTYYKNDAGSTSCDSYIAIRGDVNKATSAQYLKREFQGTGCRVDNRQNITLNDGKSNEQAQQEQTRKDLKDTRRKDIEQNADSICRRIDPDNVTACEQKLLTSFDQCYTELGGAGGIERDIGNNEEAGERALLDCIAGKTGYSSNDIQYALIPTLSTNVNKECEVRGMGWIVCQGAKLLASITDGVFAALTELMTTPPLARGAPGGEELYQAWAAIRNVANVLFVILFLAVIISYVTSAGIDNYNIKKIVPRLIVAAVLINSSFFVCAAIVDVTNILGASLKDVLVDLAPAVRPDFDGWGHVTSALLVGTVALTLYAGIFSLGPILVAGLFAMFITVVILVARQAFLIILIVISPIAFALNTLPNTQKWFSKWWSAFILLAMVFPVIGLVFGGTRIAAGVISSSAPQEEGLVTILFAVLCLGTLTIPFFVVPLALKFGGGLLNRFGGIVNNRSKGLVDRAKNRSRQAGDDLQNRRTTRALFADTKKTGSRLSPYGAHARRKNLRAHEAKYHESQLKQGDGTALDTYLANSGVIDTIARKGAQAAGESREEAIRNALRNAQIQLDTSDLEASEAVLDASSISLSDLRAITEDETGKYTDSEKAAAIRKLASQGNIDDINKLIGMMQTEPDGTGGMSVLQRHALADGIEKSGVGRTAPHLGASATNLIRSGETTPTSDELYRNAFNEGRYSPESLAQQSSKSAAGLATWANRPENSDAKVALRASAEKVFGNPKLKTNASSGTLRQLIKL